MMRIEYQDKIDEYLLNRMPEKERWLFETVVAKNEELREQLEFTKQLQAAVKSRKEKLTKISEWQEEDKKTAMAEMQQRATGSGYPATRYHKSSRPYQKRLRIVIWSLGCIAIFIAGLFIFTPLHIVEDKAHRAPLSYENIKANTNYSTIEQLIKQKMYERAIRTIEQEEQLLKSDLMPIKGGKTRKERQTYDAELLAEKTDELMWLKANALLGLGKNEEAMNLLNLLRKKEGKYQQSADSLYYRLKE